VSDAEFARIRAMARWLAEATATRVEPWRLGTAIFTDDFPGRYDSNFLRVERPLGDISAVELAGEADRIQGELRHREIVVEDAGDGARLASAFRDLGYQADELVVMAQRRDVAAGPGLPAAHEVDPRSLRPTIVATNLAIAGMTRADAEMLADFRPVSTARAGTRYVGVELGGGLVSYCELYLHDGVAQIEDVNTLEAWRNRGAGRAVVLGAAAAARAAGADLVWLVADAADWPRELYAKLGFEALGTTWQFTKIPPEHAAASLPGPAPSEP
jgi:ribosomal protein S18 acetylase RimI-like enzyme